MFKTEEIIDKVALMLSEDILFQILEIPVPCETPAIRVNCLQFSSEKHIQFSKNHFIYNFVQYSIEKVISLIMHERPRQLAKHYGCGS